MEDIIFRTEEIGLSPFVSNGPARCYHQKKAFFNRLKNIANERGMGHMADAADLDDLEDYRPGLRAPKGMWIIFSLVDAGLRKRDMRFVSKEMGLSQWNKPAIACLATRIPYGTPITAEKLNMVEDGEGFSFWNRF